MTIVNMGSKLDGRNSNKIMASLKNQSIESGHVFLDVSCLETLNSNSLATLFAVVGEVLDMGASPVIWGASAKMRAIFEMVQLNQVAEVCALDHSLIAMGAPAETLEVVAATEAARLVPVYASQMAS